jgi:outer membrane lipoprotein-sorting protein
MNDMKTLLLAILISIALWAQAPAQTQPDVARILDKVIATYQSASEYEFVLDGVGRDDGKDITFHALFAFKAPNRYRLEGAFPGMGLGGGESLAVHDGTNLWIYLAGENRYRSISANELAADAPGDLGDARPEFLDMNFRSGFAAMADQAKNGKLLREDILAMGGTSVPCWVIVSKLDGQDATMWVEKDRSVILRIEAPGTNLTFTTVKVNEPLTEDLFKFDPPPGAKKV